MSASVHHSVEPESQDGGKEWPVDLDKLQELIRVFERSQLSEIEIEEAGRRIRLSKSDPDQAGQRPYPVSPPVQFAPIAAGSQGTAESVRIQAPEEDVELTTINSPMVGVFYAAPAPGEPPFVRPGDTVDKEQTICIVEAMKLMNEVCAKFPAEIMSVLVENGEPVEYNQPLFRVRRLG